MKIEDVNLIQYINLLDGRVTELCSNLGRLRDLQTKESTNSYDLYSKLEVQLEGLASLIGNKPDSLDEQFDAPDLWLSLASVANQVNKNKNFSRSDLSALLRDFKLLLSRTNELEVDVKNLRSELTSFHNLPRQVQDLKSFTIKNFKEMIGIMKQDPNQTMPMTNHASQAASMAISQSEFSDLKNRLSHVEAEVQSHLNANDEATIKFGSLGFRSQPQATIWLKEHSPGPQFGFLIDFHMLMEFLKEDLSVGSLLKTTKKMEFTLTVQNIAVNSFNAAVPSFFTKDMSDSIIYDKDSYFSNISSYCEWCTPSTGKRERLRIKLLNFQSYFKTILDSGTIPRLSQFYNLCYSAMTETISWTENLIKFMDDTYEIYNRTQYGRAKAWHVVTRLATKLIEAVAKPRIGMHHMFHMSKPELMANVIFYTTLKSLDVMAVIKSFNFRDSPLVSSELTQFLAMITDFEAMTRLQDKVVHLEQNELDLQKQVKEAAKTASTAANKWDQTYKYKLEALEKRIKKLE